MNPQRTGIFKTLAYCALISVIAGATHLSAQGAGGRTLRDVGRGFRDRTLTAPAARALGDVADSAADAAAKEPAYRLTLTPTVGWTNSSTRYGAQAAWISNRIPLSVSLTDQVIRSDAEDRLSNRIQGDAGYDLVNDHLLGMPVYLGLFGELQHTQRSGTFAEISTELDLTILRAATGTPSVALRGLGYWDYFSPVEGSSDSGPTLGTGAILVLSDAIELDTEYDVNSAFNGEDSYSAKLLLTIPGQRLKPTLIVGGGKHNTFVLGLKLSQR
jgi:hypothetical protein